MQVKLPVPPLYRRNYHTYSTWQLVLLLVSEKDGFRGPLEAMPPSLKEKILGGFLILKEYISFLVSLGGRLILPSTGSKTPSDRYHWPGLARFTWVVLDYSESENEQLVPFLPRQIGPGWLYRSRSMGQYDEHKCWKALDCKSFFHDRGLGEAIGLRTIFKTLLERASVLEASNIAESNFQPHYISKSIYGSNLSYFESSFHICKHCEPAGSDNTFEDW